MALTRVCGNDIVRITGITESSPPVEVSDPTTADRWAEVALAE